MNERRYGARGPLYGVVEGADGWIELRVYHRNLAMRRQLQNHQGDPSFFVPRQERLARSAISAQRWLAAVIADYQVAFAANRVRVTLAGPPPPQRFAMAAAHPTPPELPAPPPGAKRVVLVACVGRKQDRPLPAQELYASDWFRKASAYARKVAGEWYILSARYGLIRPEQVIEPYDETLKTMDPAVQRNWALQVLVRLHGLVSHGDQVVILAGEAYRAHLTGPLERWGCTVLVPMKSMRIGEQLAWLGRQLAGPAPHRLESGRLADVQRFYDLLADLERRLGGKRLLGECTGRMAWPQRGVYFFFEPGEVRRTSGQGLRVVRVGTHGLRAGSQSTLWQRLHQHRGHHDGGHQRGSVFRRHVGAALMRQAGAPPAAVLEWLAGQSAPEEVRERERPVEKAVSAVIGRMSLLWLPVEDAPGPESLRGYIERNAIALLSNANYPDLAIDPAGPQWLGRWAPAEQILQSGLWNVEHVAESPDEGFLDRLAALVEAVPEGGPIG